MCNKDSDSKDGRLMLYIEGEEWRDIAGYEKKYQVSNLGRVRGVDRLNSRGFLIKGQIIKANVFGRSYYCVSITNVKRKTHKVHQLVAIAFLNHKPCGYDLVVDHIDNNPYNNNINNLQLITQRENASKDRKGSSKYTGVSWSWENDKWLSTIRIKNKQYNLGLFKNELEASNAYQTALKNK